jgi:ATP-dependent DNA helicase RecG
MISLDTKVNQLNKVGLATYSKLKRLEIETVEDLIFYYPFRYEDFSQITTINNLQIDTLATVVGKIELIASRRSFRKRKVLTEAIVTDDTGSVKVIWFNQPWIAKTLKVGDEVSLSGKVAGDLINIYFNSPEYEKVSASSTHTARIVPIVHNSDLLKTTWFLIKCYFLVIKIDDYLPIPLVKNNLSLYLKP